MSAYEKLEPHVRRIVDEKAQAAAEREGITVEEARELIALRVRTHTNTRPTPGMGH